MKWFVILWIISLDDQSTVTRKYRTMAECRDALTIIHTETENTIAGCIRRRVPPYEGEE